MQLCIFDVQAVIKMDNDGSFYINNTGKCSIFVNGKEVPCSKRINIMSDSLIEVWPSNPFFLLILGVPNDCAVLNIHDLFNSMYWFLFLI